MLLISVHVLINDNLPGRFPKNRILLEMINRERLEQGLEEIYYFFELPCHALTYVLRNVLT